MLSSSVSDGFLVILLIVSLLHSVAFNTGTFYLALYFQVRNPCQLSRTSGFTHTSDCQRVNLEASCRSHGPPILFGVVSGLHACCLASRCHSEAYAQHRWPKMGHFHRFAHCHDRVWCVWCSFALSHWDWLELSTALLCLLGVGTPTTMQSFLPLLAGIGVGMLFHAPYQAFTGALSPKELAAGTSAFFLVRFTGATVGLVCIKSFLCISFQLTRPFVLSPSQVRSTKAVCPVISCRGRTWHRNRPHQIFTVLPSLWALFGSVVFIARFLAILNSTSHTQDVWTMCAPCLGSALLVRYILVILDW